MRDLMAVTALVVALVAGCEAVAAHNDLRLERIRTDKLVRVLHNRIFQIENWHGWPPAPWSKSEVVRDHDHLREVE